MGFIHWDPDAALGRAAGTYTYASGSAYAGEWKEDMKHGKGWRGVYARVGLGRFVSCLTEFRRWGGVGGGWDAFDMLS